MSSERLELPEPSQAVLRAARALLRSKERKASGTFLAEGPQAVREALKQPGVVEAVFFRWAAVHDHVDLLAACREARTTHYAVSEQNIATISDTVTPQGVVAVCRQVDVSLEQGLEGAPRLVVICAQIRDPGNAGTVIRCADAFGADAVILSSDSVEVYNPKTVRASVGSIFHLPLVVGVDLADAIEACRAAGLQVFATDGEAGTELTDLTGRLAEPTAWVMGNESWGLPVEHLRLADTTVAVPIYGAAESLNLATAAAVCLYASASTQHTRVDAG
ncbi:TrmH family RNA methyltransferase [Micropruina sp.]|uniref:TrmH family RNA methyltransferase n=1 Tax=Micropruina sp. TaxID=2737536 RepID=UPI0039E2BA07